MRREVPVDNAQCTGGLLRYDGEAWNRTPVTCGDPTGAGTQPVAQDGSAQSSGSIDYGTLDDLGRPTGITAHLTPAMAGTGTPASRAVSPPGFEGEAAGHARGHLLGRQLGGSGTELRNLVTLYQNPANSPAMRGFENQVRAALDAGQTVDYSAIPIYVGLGLMPVGVTLRAQGSGGLDFWVSVMNRGR